MHKLTQATTPESLVELIETELDLLYSSRAVPWPRNQPIASDINPEECLRRHVLEVLAWKEKAPIPKERQPRLEVGVELEDRGIDKLRGIGLRVIRQQETFELRHRNTGQPVLRGKIDGFVERVRPAKDVPFEAKSMEPSCYRRIDTAEDFAQFWWMRRYAPQMQSYLIGYGMPWGFFWITDLRGNWKPIPVALDYELAERVWARAEVVVEHVDQHRRDPETPLPPFTTDPAECGRCGFFGRACQPDLIEMGAQARDDAGLELDLIRWRELKPGYHEYAALDKKVKTALRKGAQRQTVGEFMVALKEIAVRAFTPKPRPAGKQIRVDISWPGQQEGEG